MTATLDISYSQIRDLVLQMTKDDQVRLRDELISYQKKEMFGIITGIAEDCPFTDEEILQEIKNVRKHNLQYAI